MYNQILYIYIYILFTSKNNQNYHKKSVVGYDCFCDYYITKNNMKFMKHRQDNI